MGVDDAGRTPLVQALEGLSPGLRGVFQKVIDGVQGALQVTLVDTLVGEFHEKFNVMWNNPGNRDSARALRQCDRTHRETARNVVNEVLTSQLVVLAKSVQEAMKQGGVLSESLPDDLLSILESKVAHLEEEITALEQLIE